MKTSATRFLMLSPKPTTMDLRRSKSQEYTRKQKLFMKSK